MLRLDLQAITFDIDDPDALADRGWAAPCRPFAVSKADSAAVRIDRLDDDHDLAEHAGDAVIEQGIAAMVVTRLVEAATADASGKEGEDSERAELEGHRKPEGQAQQPGRNAGGPCPGFDERPGGRRCSSTM